MVSKKDNGPKKDWRNHGNNDSQMKVECKSYLEDSGNVHHKMGKMLTMLRRLCSPPLATVYECDGRKMDNINSFIDEIISGTEEKQDAVKSIKVEKKEKMRCILMNFGRAHSKMIQQERNQQDQLGSEINMNIFSEIIELQRMEDVLNSIKKLGTDVSEFDRMIDDENFTKALRERIPVELLDHLHTLDDRVPIAVDNIEKESSGKEVTDVKDEDIAIAVDDNIKKESGDDESTNVRDEGYPNIRTAKDGVIATEDNSKKESGDDESTNVRDEGYPYIRAAKDDVIATEDNSKKESGDEEAVDVEDEVSPNTCSVEDSVTAAVDGVEPATSLQTSVKETQYDLPKYKRLYKLRKKKEGITTTKKTEPLKRSQSYSSGDDDFANFF